MKPSLKLHSIAFGLATAIVFAIWTQLPKLMALSDYLKILIGGGVSLGIYRLIADFIINLTRKSSWVKKQLLGPSYLEGTWVGFYIGASGKVRFIIERFEQGIDSLVVHGDSYDDTMKHHTHWDSTSVNIDSANGRLSYMYVCQPIKESSNHDGIAAFSFMRDNQDSEAMGLIGYSADLHIGKRTKAMESKYSPKLNVDRKAALDAAKALYESNKGSY